MQKYTHTNVHKESYKKFIDLRLEGTIFLHLNGSGNMQIMILKLKCNTTVLELALEDIKRMLYEVPVS
jgi:hypothetical protein